ncbi:helix-turn-helix domain-containing protein [Mucilaginibacter sp. BJC16-A38]|nr:helix-turn-helix domain-containing protein [Mucilaginibacter phenanthrenivorans]
MTIEFITKEDLYVFKNELLQELLAALKQQPQKNNQWLKSCAVRKMLNVSPNTLQRLRIRGVLKFSKVGSTFYYKADDVQKMLEGKVTR